MHTSEANTLRSVGSGSFGLKYLEWSQYLDNLPLQSVPPVSLILSAPVLFWGEGENFPFLALALRRIYFHEIFKMFLCLRILIFAFEIQEQ